jgi:hypothetical protein
LQLQLDSVAQLAAGELDEEILEIRRPVQIAHAGRVREGRQQRLRSVA